MISNFWNEKNFLSEIPYLLQRQNLNWEGSMGKLEINKKGKTLLAKSRWVERGLDSTIRIRPSLHNHNQRQHPSKTFSPRKLRICRPFPKILP